jgi:hypothetical protein
MKETHRFSLLIKYLTLQSTKVTGIIVAAYCLKVNGQPSTNSPVAKSALTASSYQPKSGTYYIASDQRNSGWCIDVNSDHVSGTSESAEVSPPTADQYQTWYISPAPLVSGAFTITSNINRKKFLQPENSWGGVAGIGAHSITDPGNTIEWDPPSSAVWQAWSFVPSSTIPNTYEIVNEGSAMAIQGNIDDKSLKQYRTDDQNDAQRWYLQAIQIDPGQ